ncbi:MAG: hypothetical protein J6D06_04075 [Clostridia bacterium]|nr:hypothetical protein [Clostridia bacterium]
MIKNAVFSFAAFVLKKATMMRIGKNPLHKDNIELLFYASKAARILRKPLGELTPEEKEEWIKRIEGYRNKEEEN